MLVDETRQEARYVIRSLMRTRGFTAIAVATLALAIAASTAIFSVAYGISIRPLPYPDAVRLIRIYEVHPPSGQFVHDVSVGSFHEWRERATTLESLALVGKPRTRVLATSEGQSITTMSVSPAFFSVLGVRPLLGDGFTPEGRHVAAWNREVTLSHAAWQRLFGGRSDIIGGSLQLSGVRGIDSYRIVGVMPAAFAFEAADAWHPQVVDLPIPRVTRSWRYDRVVARLRTGTTVDQARSDLRLIAAQLASEFPASNDGWTVSVESLHDAVVGNFRPATSLLLTVVAVVVLVACLNIAALLTARNIGRTREMRVRLALGASRWRLWRLRLIEAAAVSGVGGSLGVLLAWCALAVFKATAPAGIPRLDEIAIDQPTLAVAVASTVLAVLTFTIVPLFQRRSDPLQGLDARRVAPFLGDQESAWRMLVVFAQTTGAVILVALAVMLTRSFAQLMTTDLGWNSIGVLSLRVSPPMPPELRRPWYRYVDWSNRLIAELEARPGIQRAAITTQIPLSPDAYQATLARTGPSGGTQPRWSAVQHNVSNGYFALMEIRLVSGRTFDARDHFSEIQLTSGQKSDRGVAVVTIATARALWSDRSALGQRISLPDSDNVNSREVIGVVEDIQFQAVGEEPTFHVFVPWAQQSTGRPCLLVKGTASEPPTRLVREAVQAVERGTHVDQVASLSALLSRATAEPRFTSEVVAGFAVVALTLAAIGIYGTLSHLVGARTREIGIRLALGAPRAKITSSVLWCAIAPALGGEFAGLILTAGMLRQFRTLLGSREFLDTTSLATASVVLLAVALTAALGPANRAARIDPASALRAD